MKAWGHGGLRYIPFQELKAQTGQIMADTVMRCFPSPLSFPHVNMSLGDPSHRETAWQGLWHLVPECRDLQGSERQAGQVAAPNGASLPHFRYPSLLGLLGKEEFIWGLAAEETKGICKN